MTNQTATEHDGRFNANDTQSAIEDNRDASSQERRSRRELVQLAAIAAKRNSATSEDIQELQHKISDLYGELLKDSTTQVETRI